MATRTTKQQLAAAVHTESRHFCITITGMTTGNAGFDARLNEVLDQQAERTGESVTEYVRRAVVTRLVKELTEDQDSELGDLLRRLEPTADPIASPTDNGAAPEQSSAITDPDRVAAVERTGLLDTPSEQKYDRIVSMAADALSAPSAAISLIDDHRQFIKSATGLGPDDERLREVPLEQSMCKYTIEAGEPVMVEDARLDEGLRTHPMVLNNTFVAYLGIPLVDDGGLAVGTLCVWDPQPRQWTTGHVQVLKDIAWMVRERIFE